jgi:alpha-tubulin suppressor-like RCC1 family protein
LLSVGENVHREHCAVIPGTVLAWGGNEVGQLGDGSTAVGPTPVPVPVDLPARTRVIAIAAGGYDSLALTAPIPCRRP